MAIDFDDFMDEEYAKDESLDEFSPEDIANIKRARQDANMGLTFTMEDRDGELGFKCNKCGRWAAIHDRPFPHKFDCPMRD